MIITSSFSVDTKSAGAVQVTSVPVVEEKVPPAEELQVGCPLGKDAELGFELQ